MEEKQLKKLENMKKRIGIAKVIINIFRVLLVVFFLLCSAIVIMSYVIPDELNAGMIASGESMENIGDVTLSNGFAQIAFRPDVAKYESEGRYAEIVRAYGFISMALVAGVLFMFSMIHKMLTIVIENDSPFHPMVLKKLRNLLIAFVIICLLTMKISIGIIVAVVSWTIYCIMDYGTLLQQDVDDIV